MRIWVRPLFILHSQDKKQLLQFITIITKLTEKGMIVKL